MSLTTYNDLKSAVARWTGGFDSATPATMGMANTIDDLITVAEARIFREAWTKDREATFNTAISSGAIAVPADYVKFKFAYIDGTRLDRRSANWIYANFGSSSGRPEYIARDSGNFIFGPNPDSAYTVKGIYYKNFPPLSSAPHALYTNNPDLYLFACLAESIILIGRDDRIPLWETKYNAILNKVNLLDQAEEVSGGDLQMRLG